MITHKQILQKADDLSKAADKVIKALAQDGIALEGFMQLTNAKAEYDKAITEYRFEKTLRMLLHQKGTVRPK